MRYMRSQPK